MKSLNEVLVGAGGGVIMLASFASFCEPDARSGLRCLAELRQPFPHWTRLGFGRLVRTELDVVVR